MKLATLKNCSRDGKLVVVSRDLTRYTDASFLVPTLQAALDNWQRIAPHLSAMAESLETGAVPSARFHEHDALAPLPRAYGRIGPLTAPRDPLCVSADAALSAHVVAIVDDIARGVDEAAARDAILLVMLATGVGHSAGSACSPVAVTPDELADAWGGATLDLPVHLEINGKTQETGMEAHDLVATIVSAAASGPIGAGAILGLPGSADATAVGLRAGDLVRIEVKDRNGHSIFGAIEQQVEAA